MRGLQWPSSLHWGAWASRVELELLGGGGSASGEQPKPNRTDVLVRKGRRASLVVRWLRLKWSESRSVMSDSLQPHELYSPWNSPGQNTGVGSLSLPQQICLTQESNWGRLHCRQILYQLSHKGSPRILEWVAYPFPSRFSQPRNQTRVSCIAGGFFTNWAMKEAVAKTSFSQYRGHGFYAWLGN